MLKRLALILTLATTLISGLPTRALALDIYEPDSPYATAPNALLTHTASATEASAQVTAAGAELVTANPRFANAVVTMDAKGTMRADVYVRIQRVMSLVGDDGSRAGAFAEALNRAQKRGDLRADMVRPARHKGQYVLMAGTETLLSIDEKLAASQGAKPAMLVLRWIDTLRSALGGSTFSTANRGGMFFAGSLTGHASWYGPGFNGRRSASGERFDQNAMTAAHKTLPFGTVLLVTNLNNSRTALVRINDRGPYIAGRMIDLSAGAARAIGIAGVGRVRIDVLKP